MRRGVVIYFGINVPCSHNDHHDRHFPDQSQGSHGELVPQLPFKSSFNSCKLLMNLQLNSLFRVFTVIWGYKEYDK